MSKVVFETVTLTMGLPARTALAGWSLSTQISALREAEELCRAEMGSFSEMSEGTNLGGICWRNGFLFVFQIWPNMFHIERVQLQSGPLGPDRSFFILPGGRGLVEGQVPSAPVLHDDPESPDTFAQIETTHGDSADADPEPEFDSGPLRFSFSTGATNELARLTAQHRLVALQAIRRAAYEAAPALPGDTGHPVEGSEHLFLGCPTSQLGIAFLIGKRTGTVHVHRIVAAPWVE